jgi:hypothetical protein
MSTEQLTEALQAAASAAQALAHTEDGGTCNFDTAVFFPPPTLRTRTIQEAATAAGVNVGVSKWMRARCVFVYVGTGQGNRHSRMAEAATKALKAAGLEAQTYYQMD